MLLTVQNEKPNMSFVILGGVLAPSCGCPKPFASLKNTGSLRIVEEKHTCFFLKVKLA